MQILKQLTLIAAFCLVGELISWVVKSIFPVVFIPGALIGMILLFVLLYTKVVKLKWIDTVGMFFINNMSFFFIPAAVSVMDHFDLLKTVIGKILLVTVISFLVTFTAIAFSVKLTLLIQEKVKAKKEAAHE